MRLLIVGASGRTGRLLVELALARGHEVTALVRDPARFSAARPGLRVLVGDVLAPGTLPPALEGQDAVVSLLAPRPRTNGRVYLEGTRNLADAAVRAGVRRLVVVSAAGAGVDGRALSLGFRLVRRIPVVARLYPDIARMEQELCERTDLDWTIVRPPLLTNGARTARPRDVVGRTVPHGTWLSRADLAEYLLGVLESGDHVREVVAVAR